MRKLLDCDYLCFDHSKHYPEAGDRYLILEGVLKNFVVQIKRQVGHQSMYYPKTKDRIYCKETESSYEFNGDNWIEVFEDSDGFINIGANI